VLKQGTRDIILCTNRLMLTDEKKYI